MKSTRVKITEKGWGGYNGILGDYEFVDGVSVEEVSPRGQAELGGNIQVAAVDERGETQEQVGAAASLQAYRNADAHHIAKEQKRLQKEADKAKGKTAVEKVKEKLGNGKYTPEKLQETANLRGIAGLREIAAEVDPAGSIKGRSNADIVKEILKFQLAQVEKDRQAAPKTVEAAEAAKVEAAIEAEAANKVEAAAAKVAGEAPDTAIDDDVAVVDGGPATHDIANFADSNAG